MQTESNTANAPVQDSITCLHCVGPHRANKFLRANGKVEDYDAGMKFVPESYPVNNIHELALLLETLNTEPQRLVIRGEIRTPPEPGSLVYRRNATFAEKPRYWLCVDVDDLKAPMGMSPISNEAIEFLVEHLPPELRDVSYVVQFSNQAGTKKAGQLVKAHLWFWTRDPASSEHLKRWAKAWNAEMKAKGFAKKLIDHSIYQQVQPHYVAAPTFENPNDDPFAGVQRTRLIIKDKDFAVLVSRTKTSALPTRPTLPVPASVPASVAGEDGRLIDGREGVARDIRFKTYHELAKRGELGLERFLQESWAEFERCCVTEATSESANEYSFESWVTICERDFERLNEFFDIKRNSEVDANAVSVAEPYFKTSPVSLEEAQERVQRVAMEFISNRDRRDTLINVTMGVGKTTTVAKVLAQHLLGEVAHVFAPTLERCEEWASIIRETNSKLRVQVIKGRKPENCRRYNHTQEAVEVGIPVRVSCCVRELKPDQIALMKQQGRASDLRQVEGKKNLCSVCPHYQFCRVDGYESQFVERADVYIFATVNLSIPKRDEVPKADFVIVDEECLSTLCRVTTAKHGDWYHEVPIALRKLIDESLKNKVPLLGALRDGGWSKERLHEVISAIKASLRVMNGITSPHEKIFTHGKETRKKAKASRKILGALKSEIGLPRDNSNKVRLVGGTVRVAELKDAGRLNAPTLFLDGTGNVELLERIKPHVREVRVDAERNARVLQVGSNTLGISSFKDGAEGRAIQFERIQAMLSRHDDSYDKPALVTYKGLKESVALSAKWQVGHFGNIRGSNTMKDSDAIFVVGNFNPPSWVAEDRAAALWGDADEELKFSDALVREWRGYRMRTGGHQVQVSIHQDRRIQLCSEIIREAECVQALDRLRAVRAEHRKDIFIVSSVPVDVTVDKVISLNDLAFGSLLEHVLIALDGVVPLSKPLLCGLLPDLFENERATRSFIEEVRKRLKAGTLPFVSSIFQFRRKGQAGGKATECVYVEGHPMPRCTLERWVGELGSYDGPGDVMKTHKVLFEDEGLRDVAGHLEAALNPPATKWKPAREWAMHPSL